MRLRIDADDCYPAEEAVTVSRNCDLGELRRGVGHLRVQPVLPLLCTESPFKTVTLLLNQRENRWWNQGTK